MVRACGYGYITLAESPGVTLYNAYEIQLGMDNNLNSVLYKHGEVSAEAEARISISQQYFTIILLHFQISSFSKFANKDRSLI